MYRFLVIVLFLISAVSFGWAMHKYASSGEEVISKPLKGLYGNEILPSLTLDMSPVRVFLEVKSEINVQDVSNPAYAYEIDIIDPVGRRVGGEARTQTEKKEDTGSSFEKNTLNHVIDTFEITESGQFVMNWKLMPKRAKIISIGYSLRKNVEGMNIPLMIFAGGCFVLGWIVLFFGRRSS
ncbi:MAG: hypothetical protein JJ879_11000 [Sneathiella sp.]|nr:hypothetical protein [Sneathiella sp.]